MLVPELRDASLEIILTARLNQIWDPRPHNIPLEPHFSFPMLIKVVDNGTLTNRFPREHIFSTDCDPLLTLQNP